MRAGRGEFLAELRPAVPVFVRFGGVDFDADPTAPARLDAFVVAVQRVIDGYGGNLLQLTVGDKGAYLYAVFGAPIAHEDDAARACAAALEVAGLEDGGVRDVSVGIASGRLRSGTYGHPSRRTFCCLGDGVNLAARLMSKAEPGTVLVSEAVAAAAGDHFDYGAQMKVALKGRSAKTGAVVVLGQGSPVAGMTEGGMPPVVGRSRELEQLVGTIGRAVTRHGDHPRVVGLTAEVGAGKSRLLSETLTRLRETGLRTLSSTAPTRGIVPAYSAWWPLWCSLLELDPWATPAEAQAHLGTHLPEQLRSRLPLVGALVGIPLPENELTAALDGELRKKSLEQLALALLERSVAEQPLVLAIDDAHALDPLARDLLVAVLRRLPGLQLAIVLAYRPGEEPVLGLGGLSVAEELVLDTLDPAAARSMADRALSDLFGGSAPPGLVDLVVERAEGNPLWVRELCRYLHERAVDGDGAAQPVDAADLPDTLHGLVLGRLDLLEETPRRTAKVASVVGRRFAGLMMREAWPDLGAEGDVRAALQTLQRRGVATPEDLTADTWMFTHGVLRDVAYESLPLSVRAEIHDAVAVVLESGLFGETDRHLDDLAHHAWHGLEIERKRRWLLAAAEAAQGAYANDTALLHLGRLLTVATEDALADVHIRIGKVLELQSEWEQAEDAYARARAAAERAQDREAVAWAVVWSAEVARKRGLYPDAQRLLDEAAVAFLELEDLPGQAQVWHFVGTLEAQQGELQKARRHYLQSLEVREQLADQAGVGALLSNLAIVAEYEGDYAEAGSLGERALAVRRELGDRWAIGISQNNLGMLATLRGDPGEAKERFAESMALHREVGDTWMVALGHHNLGNAHRDLGEHAEAHATYLEALAAYRGFGDEWALAVLYEDAALLLAAAGELEDAWRLVGASDHLHERIGSPRTPDVSTRLEERLLAMSSSEAAERLAEGRSWGVDQVQRVLGGAVLAAIGPGIPNAPTGGGR